MIRYSLVLAAAVAASLMFRAGEVRAEPAIPANIATARRGCVHDEHHTKRCGRRGRY